MKYIFCKIIWWCNGMFIAVVLPFVKGSCRQDGILVFSSNCLLHSSIRPLSLGKVNLYLKVQLISMTQESHGRPMKIFLNSSNTSPWFFRHFWKISGLWSSPSKMDGRLLQKLAAKAVQVEATDWYSAGEGIQCDGASAGHWGTWSMWLEQPGYPESL